MKTLLTLTAGALALGAAAGPALAQEVTLRVHHFLPPAAPAHAGYIEPWAQRIEEQSDGRIDVQIFPAMQLGGAPPALMDQAIDGVADVVWTITGYTPGRFPMAEVFDLPFMPASAEATSQAAYEFYETYLQEELGDVHIIMVHTHGPGLLHVRGEPVENLDDLEGLKVRGPTRMITALLDQLGATPVGMPVPQVPEALSRGVVDATVLPWEVTRSLRVPELVDTHTNFTGDRGLYTTMFVYAMNKDFYEGLPDDLKAVIDANSGIEEAAAMGRNMDAADIPAYDMAVELGNPIITLDAEETERWREAAQPVIDNWIAEMDEMGHDGQALVDAARELIAKYAE